jgi:hypothetical protein
MAGILRAGGKGRCLLGSSLRAGHSGRMCRWLLLAFASALLSACATVQARPATTLSQVVPAQIQQGIPHTAIVTATASPDRATSSADGQHHNPETKPPAQPQMTPQPSTAAVGEALPALIDSTRPASPPRRHGHRHRSAARLYAPGPARRSESTDSTPSLPNGAANNGEWMCQQGAAAGLPTGLTGLCQQIMPR